MGTLKAELLNIAKIGGSLGSFALASSIDPSGGFISKAIEAITGNLASNFIGKYDPAVLLKYLEKSSELNHDIEKLMIDSVEKAVKLVTVKYLAENPYDDTFVKETLKSLIEDAKIMSENADFELMATDKDAWIESIDEYIFRGRTDEDGKLTEIADFFKKHLKPCYELVFNEGLKDDKDEKPLKAFLIKSLNGLAAQADQNSEIQQKILDEIQNLKANQASPSLDIAKSYFKQEFDKIDKKLVELLEIAKKTDGKIDLIYEYFGIIEQKIDEIINTSKENLDISNKIFEILSKSSNTSDTAIFLSGVPINSKIEIVGRENDVKDVIEILDLHSQVLIWGMKGIGKTTLAKSIVKTLFGLAKLSHIIWLNDGKNLANAFVNEVGFVRLLDEIENTKISKSDNIQIIKKIILPHLLKINGEMNLIVIDNLNLNQVKFFKEISSKLPNWKFLITSYEKISEQLVIYPLQSLSVTECRKLFNQYFEKITKDDFSIDILTGMLGNHTLTIEILAKTANLLELEPKELLERFQKRGFDISPFKLDLEVGHSQDFIDGLLPYYNTIFDMSPLSEIEKFAIIQLSIFNTPTKKTFYKEIHHGNEEFSENFFLAIKKLEKKGWIIINQDTFFVHQIIQKIILTKFNVKFEDYLYTIIGSLLLVNRNMIISPKKVIEYIPYFETIILQFDTENDKFLSNLIESVAAMYLNLGYLEKALKLFNKLLEKSLIILGENHSIIAGIYNNLGIAHVMSENNIEAENCYSKSIEILSNLADNNYSENIARTKSNLSEIYLKNGNYQKAIETTTESLTILEGINDSTHDDSIELCYNSLGTIYIHLKEYDKAIENLNKALNVLNRMSLVTDHPSFARVYNNLGLVHFETQKYETAIEYFISAINIWQKNLSNNTDLAVCYRSVGLLFKEIKSYEEWIRFLSISYGLHEKIFGKDNAYTIEIKFRVNEFYYDSGALKYFEKKVQSLNISDENYDWYISILANLYSLQKQKEKADIILDKLKDKTNIAEIRKVINTPGSFGSSKSQIDFDIYGI